MGRIDRRRKGLLILECDAETLARDNLAVGEELASLAKSFFRTNPIRFVRTFREADLLKTLLEISETGQKYRNVVVIGHSNRRSLKIAADRSVSWAGLAKWIDPFEPHRVMLLACEAGRWLPCAALFNGVPTLKEIFGSPVLACKNQRSIVLARTLYVLGASREDGDLVQLMQIGNFLLTRGLMFRRTRSEYERGGHDEGEFWTDIAEPLLEALVRNLR